MKNITFSAKEEHIARAREAAAAKKRTLNDEFREWLEHYPRSSTAEQDVEGLRDLMERLQYIHLHGPYTRDELNERR
jgi:hypothetical protein